jgi:phosphoribosyl-ATP pyrophosphohydrolase
MRRVSSTVLTLLLIQQRSEEIPETVVEEATAVPVAVAGKEERPVVSEL